MTDALYHSGVSQLMKQGLSGKNTIIVLIDDFPSESSFYDYFPLEWKDRILHYPSDPGDGKHGIMTASIAATVAPQALLYFIEMKNDPISCFQEIMNLKQTYPNYDIISSNSYVYGGTAYYDPLHPVNRKILETAESGVTIVFGAGNWAHPGEHTSRWTLDVGYDSRNSYFDRDSEIGYPGVFDEVISVAGCNAFCDKIVSYSSLGRGVDNHDEPDVSAPTHFSFEHSPYDHMALGTSASTPFMAGICADILSGKNAEVIRLVGSIHSYSTDKGYNGFDDEFGYGVVNAVNIFNNYDYWQPSQNISPIAMYSISMGMLGIGIVLYNKKGIENIIGR